MSFSDGFEDRISILEHMVNMLLESRGLNTKELANIEKEIISYQERRRMYELSSYYRIKDETED